MTEDRGYGERVGADGGEKDEIGEEENKMLDAQRLAGKEIRIRISFNYFSQNL